MTEQTDFDATLTRAFALAAEPQDDGFTAAVSQQVAQVEGRRRMGRGARSLMLAGAGGAVAFAVWEVLQVAGAPILAAMGPDLAMLATAQLPTVSLGLPALLLLGAAAGFGAAWMQRTND
jgi:hypothetical protein